MTREEASIIIGNIPINGDGCYTISEYQEAKAKAIEVLEQEPCEDCVSRQTVKEQMIKYGFLAPDMTVTEFVEDELPPVTPKPKTGKWIEITTPRGTVIALRCSVCEKSPKHAIRSDFCPHCGADMRGGKE